MGCLYLVSPPPITRNSLTRKTSWIHSRTNIHEKSSDGWSINSPRLHHSWRLLMQKPLRGGLYPREYDWRLQRRRQIAHIKMQALLGELLELELYSINIIAIHFLSMEILMRVDFESGIHGNEVLTRRHDRWTRPCLQLDDLIMVLV